ncbi:sigma-54-dependent Fis family transcriptional regulator [Maridesulfovibrio bastinii]|uniref:sigma-54-dependent Fis family transcriptional regulator n=1 Tax=Maridesulfovibrio bastinii TaxID=47157 RepID=UPI000402F9B6|nr:sigma-54-dependent Fis family transcriptional regulator [Maridesulfovibrio bastinii]
MKDILVIAPLKEVYDKTVEIIEEHKYDNVAVELGTMQQGLKKAIEGEKLGASVIVSRGWTYKKIENELEIPSIEIPVSAYDIVETLTPILEQINHQQTIGVIGHDNVIYGFDILRNLLPMKIVKIELEREEDIASAIKRYKNSGISTFIGDSNVKAISEALGHTGIAISSQKESILRSIQEAVKLHNSIRNRQQRAQLILTVTDYVHEGIIAIDETEKVSIFNHTAEDIFGIRKDQAIGHLLKEAAPRCQLPLALEESEPSIGEVLDIGGKKLVVNRAPVLINDEVVGAVATFQNVAEVQNVEQKIRRELAEHGFSAKYTFNDIIQKSPLMEACIAKAEEYALYDTPMLITGESGVGKELFCQSLHNASPRRNGPFVAINCAAIPPSLMEAELFGHESGAFTGAKSKGRAGIFELAHKGTVFLDEIGEIPLEFQGRLLRVLQEHQIMRIGGDKIIPVDVRILCATNRPLAKMVEEDKFRRDLLFRINVLTLNIPSLRRLGPETIMLLAEHFLAKYARKYSKKIPEITPEIKKILISKPYRGNVREIEGLMERSVILGNIFWAIDEEPETEKHSGEIPDVTSLPDLRSMEEAYIRKVFNQTGENVQETCSILKISRSTLWRRLKETSRFQN